MKTKISLSQIGLYNPQRQSNVLTEKLFVIRQKQFESLMENLNEEAPDSIPQHYLILAQRGMGKTTLLKRIEVELHKEQYKQKFIPLLFPEEQYGLRDLTEFWLNCLDALTDSLDVEKYGENGISKIDKHIQELMDSKNPDDINEKLYRYLMLICRKMNRRPVLLIDNIGLIFNRLSKKEQYVLRGYISENACPIIISAGVSMAGYSDVKENVIDYKAPFYDFFQIHYLRKMNIEEFMELMQNLSNLTQTNISITSKELPRLQSLLQLTGGNPRISVMLFKLLVKGFSDDIVDDLEALLDELTPLYKSRFEELPSQQQIILDTVAQNWNPMSLREISEETRYENNQLSPQIKRLIEGGWLETTKAENAKGNAYSIPERFFCIYHIMRNGSRRSKKQIAYLSKFLESFYGSISDYPKVMEPSSLYYTKNHEISTSMDADYLEQALFALKERNEGIASSHLSEALKAIKEKLNSETQGNWEYFAAITIKLGYAQWLLNMLSEKGFDIILSPFFVAIQALEIERTKKMEAVEIYLKNQAVEKSDPARIIMENMKIYM